MAGIGTDGPAAIIVLLRRGEVIVMPSGEEKDEPWLVRVRQALEEVLPRLRAVVA